MLPYGYDDNYDLDLDHNLLSLSVVRYQCNLKSSQVMFLWCSRMISQWSGAFHPQEWFASYERAANSHSRLQYNKQVMRPLFDNPEELHSQKIWKQAGGGKFLHGQISMWSNNFEFYVPLVFQVRWNIALPPPEQLASDERAAKWRAHLRLHYNSPYPPSESPVWTGRLKGSPASFPFFLLFTLTVIFGCLHILSDGWCGHTRNSWSFWWKLSWKFIWNR